MNDDECDRLRSLLRLSKEPGIPDGGQDAGVLILLDGTPDDYQVFLCIRSDEMRRHPGEVCFPGGMRDADENLQETAIREAEEEVGLQRDDFILLGSLPSFRARFGVLIHPTVALLRRPFFPRLNVHEVKDTFWMPLERFLDNSLHMSFIVDNTYAVHSFSVEPRTFEFVGSGPVKEKAQMLVEYVYHLGSGKKILLIPSPGLFMSIFFFEEAHTYGVTALMCIVTAMGVLQKMPTFDIAPLLPISRLSTMTPAEVMTEVCEYAGQPYERLSKL